MASPVLAIIFSLLSFFLHLSPSSSALLLPLSHSLPAALINSTTHHLLRSTASRSAARFRRGQVSVPLSSGSDYTLSLSLGGQTVSLYMDTGSDVVWLPCHPFECILCEGKPSPTADILNLTSAAPVPCNSVACSAVHSSLPHRDLCAVAGCPLDAIETGGCGRHRCPRFYYAYGDGSLIASLYKDELSVPPSALRLPEFTFGCAHAALGEPIGVAGFGRGILSLPAQLASASPEIGNYFSYCLISHSFDSGRVSKPSPLILGRHDKKLKDKFDDELIGGYAFTPMLDNPKHSYFYCVGLEAISVGKRRILAPESLKRIDRKGSGGMVVDSGTTFTMLPTDFYQSLVDAFETAVGRVHRRATALEERTGLGRCYHGRAGEKSLAGVPKLVLHFAGNSSVVLPRRNYFYEFFDADARREAGCVMVMDGGSVAERGGGPAGLLGNYQQQGFEVVYDLEEKRVGFARRRCASLWDALN